MGKATVGAFADMGQLFAINQAAQDAEQLRIAHADFAAKRESKRGFWESRKRDVLELANGVGGFAENTAFPAAIDRTPYLQAPVVDQVVSPF